MIHRARKLAVAAIVAAGTTGCGDDASGPPAVTADPAPGGAARAVGGAEAGRSEAGPSEAESSLRKLVAAHHDLDHKAWTEAKERLDALGPGAIPAYVAALAGDDAKAREFAAMQIAELGIDATPAAGALVEALEDPLPMVRVNAAAALSILEDPRRARAVPVLASLLEGQPAFISETAAVALGNFRQEAAGAVPALAQALSAEEPALRESAARTLGLIGPAAQEAVPALEKTAADDASPQVREAASQTLDILRPANDAQAEPE